MWECNQDHGLHSNANNLSMLYTELSFKHFLQTKNNNYRVGNLNKICKINDKF